MARLIVGGITVSSGIGVGNIFVLKQAISNINNGKILDNEVKNEISKLELAITSTQIELHDLKNNFKDSLNERDNSIFEAYKMILKDVSFLQEIKDLIRIYNYHAEYAVDLCISNYIKALLDSDNVYMKERVHDLLDIKQRIIRNIQGENIEDIGKVNDGHIVCLKHLTPSLAASFAKAKVVGVITEEGAAYLSHAAIILRGLGIPTLDNIKFDQIKDFDKTEAVIDSENSKLIINPEKAEVEKYRLDSTKTTKYKNIFKDFLSNGKCAVTSDKYKIDVTANIGCLEELDSMNETLIDGIGLVRTEILFIKNKNMPNEDEQYEIYSQIVNKMNNKPVVIRTVDLGDDKKLGGINMNTNSSIDDLRGIKYSLAQKALFKSQLKAIVRSAKNGDVRVTFPMVTGVDEIIEAKEILEIIYQELGETNKIQVGAVIETKMAVENLEEILEEVDFINIGTNDLIEQYVGVERSNVFENKIYCSLPNILSIIYDVITLSKEKNKRVSVCGEMASDEVVSILLLGMGADELSIVYSEIDKLCDSIQKITFEEAEKLSMMALDCDDIEGVRKILLGRD